jgi:hypothetical protein
MNNFDFAGHFCFQSGFPHHGGKLALLSSINAKYPSLGAYPPIGLKDQIKESSWSIGYSREVFRIFV